MQIEAVDFFYLSMPEVLDIGDGSQDALLVRVVAGGYTGWGECEASPLVSINRHRCMPGGVQTTTVARCLPRRRRMGANMRHVHKLGGLLLALMLAGCGASSNAGTAFPSIRATLPPLLSPPAVSPTAAAPSAPSESAEATALPAPSPEPSAPAATASGAATETPFDPAAVQIGLEEVAGGFQAPVFVGHAGDGSGRVFVVEKGGRVLTLDGDVFLDISDRVNAGGNEQGLLGLAFHPDFERNGFLYVAYTDADGNHAISRFTAQGDSADPASESFVLQVEDPAGNHNGGMLAFGPDGYLYIALGDGGGAGDSYGNGQNTGTLLGKLLRLDVDGGEPYVVPEDNPFVGQDNVRGEIFSYGLRNPWRFSFDRESGDLYIGDVGQNRYEWLHVRPAGEQGGENFGWPILEGRSCFRGQSCDRTGLTEAVVDYPHSEGCSVVGGYVYRGQQYPALRGGYVLGDYCSGNMWTMSQTGDGWTLTPAPQAEDGISSFGEDEAGELYMSNLDNGVIYRVTGTPR